MNSFTKEQREKIDEIKVLIPTHPTLAKLFEYLELPDGNLLLATALTESHTEGVLTSKDLEDFMGALGTQQALVNLQKNIPK